MAAKHENYGKIKLQLPTALKKINHGWIKRISGLENAWLLLLVSFALGVFISVGEFLCTGQIFLELGDIFLEAEKHNKPDIPWRELPEKVHQYLNVQGNINRVVIKKQF